eukprot:COSAG04_NODE_18223_length_448_cov_0.848138_1_plen_44_part_01
MYEALGHPRKDSKRATEMAISYRTFKTIMREEQAKNDKGHAAVD